MPDSTREALKALIAKSAILTPCECRAAGFCPRHGVDKSDPRAVYFCQTRPDYFELWERGQGPGQPGGAELNFLPVAVIAGRRRHACTQAPTR